MFNLMTENHALENLFSSVFLYIIEHHDKLRDKLDVKSMEYTGPPPPPPPHMNLVPTSVISINYL